MQQLALPLKLKRRGQIAALEYKMTRLQNLGKPVILRVHLSKIEEQYLKRSKADGVLFAGFVSQLHYLSMLPKHWWHGAYLRSHHEHLLMGAVAK